MQRPSVAPRLASIALLSLFVGCAPALVTKPVDTGNVGRAGSAGSAMADAPAASVVPEAPASDAPTSPLPPVDPSVVFSVAVRSDEIPFSIAPLARETVLHASSLVLHVVDDVITQDAGDLRGVSPQVLSDQVARLGQIHGPSFREAFFELWPGNSRYGGTVVYAPLVRQGSFDGFRAAKYGPPGAHGFGFRVGPRGSVWGLSLRNHGDPSALRPAEEIVSHLAGPALRPEIVRPAELGNEWQRTVLPPTRYPFTDGWQRTVTAPDGTSFTVGEAEEDSRHVVLRRRTLDRKAQRYEVPNLPPEMRSSGFTFSALGADAAFLHGTFTIERAANAHGSYAAVWDGVRWQAESAPPDRVLRSFCLHPDGTRWAISRPAGDPSLQPASPRTENLLLKRRAGGEWQRIALPADVSPERVQCDDPHGLWLHATETKGVTRSQLLMRSRPVKAPVEVSIVDWPRDGDVRRDDDPGPLLFASSPAEPATSVCPPSQLWAVLAREGGRLIEDRWLIPPRLSAKEKAAAARTVAEQRRANDARLRPLLKATTLPDGATLELVGQSPHRWIATLVPDYTAGRKLVDASIVRFPEERPKLLCVVPDKRAPYDP